MSAPTKTQRKRFEAFQRIGCIACRQKGRYSQADVHHLLSGGRRRGHAFTIPLCPWHHRGVPPDGFTQVSSRVVYGPSLALTSRDFHATFGADLDLWLETERLLTGKGPGRPEKINDEQRADLKRWRAQYGAKAPTTAKARELGVCVQTLHSHLRRA